MSRPHDLLGRETGSNKSDIAPDGGIRCNHAFVDLGATVFGDLRR
jgi:hypothetical protein